MYDVTDQIPFVRLFVGARIWLQMGLQRRIDSRMPNQFLDNWLYMQEFTPNFTAVTHGRIAGAYFCLDFDDLDIGGKLIISLEAECARRMSGQHLDLQVYQLQ